jgi:recombination protein RecA
MAVKQAVKYHPKIAKFFASVEKRKGNLMDSVVQPSFRMECINTGSTVLNILIGGSRLQDGSFICPGYPKGKIWEIFGRESSGKSTIALTAMGQACSEKEDGTGLYIDLEHAVVDSYAMKLGCDFRPPELGGNGRCVRAAPHTAEEVEAMVDTACLHGISLIVIDSVAGLVSKREYSRDITDEKQKLGVAEVPRFMANWMPKLQDIISHTKTTVLFLNQTRDKIGAKGFTEEALKSTTGGNALKFWAAGRWLLQPKAVSKAKIYNPLLKETEEVPIATDISVKNIKNKIDARQGHSGLITIRYGVGIDEMRTMMNVACAYEIVKHTKNKQKQDVFEYKSSGSGRSIQATGIEKFRRAIQDGENKAEYDEMMGACVERIMSGFKTLDDEALSRLAEDAVTMEHKVMDDDDYADPDAPDGPSDPRFNHEDTDAAEGPSIDASEV